jgi:hypothetical protein
MRPILSLVFALALSIGSQGAIAQSDMIDGQVMKVDQSAGKITIKHGPAKKLGMENGMTMVYRAQDPASTVAWSVFRRRPRDQIRLTCPVKDGGLTMLAACPHLSTGVFLAAPTPYYWLAS